MERKKKAILSQNVGFSLGGRRKLHVWKDVWYGEVTLSIAFPTLFNLETFKDAKVADV